MRRPRRRACGSCWPLRGTRRRPPSAPPSERPGRTTSFLQSHALRVQDNGSLHSQLQLVPHTLCTLGSVCCFECFLAPSRIQSSPSTYHVFT